MMDLRSWRPRLAALALVGTLFATPPAHAQPLVCAGAPAAAPSARAHAHNDYEHGRPLLDALDNGFASVEADVWLVDGELRVAHDEDATVPGRTLESLYLRPLLERVRTRQGRVYAGWPHSVQLLIDLKSEAEATYAAVHAALARHPLLFTTFTSTGADERAVTVVISGNRPRETMAAQRVRFAAYDGRLSELGDGSPDTLIPLISDRWGRVFSWQGEGPMPATQRTQLRDIVAKAHASRQRVRFWATPEGTPAREAVWAELLAAGVDYVGTDHLAELRAWLLASDPRPAVPPLDLFRGRDSCLSSPGRRCAAGR